MMKNKNSDDDQFPNRLFEIIKKADQYIEEWTSYLVEEIENHQKSNSPNQNR